MDILYYILVILIVLLSLYLYGRKTFCFFNGCGIKGPEPTAYIGNMIEISKKGLSMVFFDWNKKYGDTYRFFLGTAPVMVVNDPEIIREIIIKNFSNFINRPATIVVDQYTANMVTAAKDEHWKYLHMILSTFYSADRIRKMVPLIEDVLKTFQKNLNKLADKNEAVDISNLFSGYTMDVIASTGFGISVDSQENPDSPVVKNARNVFSDKSLKSLQVIGVFFPSLARFLNNLKPGLMMGGLAYFIDFCKEILEERKKDPNNKERKDLLQLMVNAQLEGHEKLDKKTEQNLKLENVTDWRTKRGPTDLEIIAQFIIVFIAGFDTTATTLSFFAHCIATNPDIQDKLYQEIEDQLGEESPNYDNVQKLTYLEMCLEETLRLYPIGFFLSREAKEDCIIKGWKIPKNSGIMIPVICIHRDPKYWPEPEKFDPERFNEENKAKQKPFTYLPFGGGPRICAGMRLAQLEFKMAVVQMLRNFRLVACEKTEKKIEFGRAIILKPKNGIWLKVERRLPKLQI